jgi:hypothetical protein
MLRFPGASCATDMAGHLRRAQSGGRFLESSY